MEISVKNSKIFVYLFIVVFIQCVLLGAYGGKWSMALLPIIAILATFAFRPVS